MGGGVCLEATVSNYKADGAMGISWACQSAVATADEGSEIKTKGAA